MNARRTAKGKHKLFSNRVQEMLQPVFSFFPPVSNGTEAALQTSTAYFSDKSISSVQYKSPGFLAS